MQKPPPQLVLVTRLQPRGRRIPSPSCALQQRSVPSRTLLLSRLLQRGLPGLIGIKRSSGGKSAMLGSASPTLSLGLISDSPDPTIKLRPCTDLATKIYPHTWSAAEHRLNDAWIIFLTSASAESEPAVGRPHVLRHEYACHAILSTFFAYLKSRLNQVGARPS